MSKGTLPHWDLSNVYPGLESKEFQQAVSQARTKLEVLDQYLSSNQIGRDRLIPSEPPQLAEIMAGYLERMNALVRLVATLRAYIASFVATDSYNTTARRLMSELEPMMVHMDQQEVLFRGWIGTAYLNRDPKASSPGAGHQFVTAARGESLVELPPGPPSATFTREAPKGGE
mgnify:CR=1 FL=1